MGDGMWAEMAKENMPKFSIKYFDFSFANNKSVYKFVRNDEKAKMPWDNEGENENIWYNDHNTGTFTNLRTIVGETYLLKDSMQQLEWKLISNETREIAGFYCKKAMTKIFDSVYVFAFYTEEITISGGPMGLHGLSGMILGVTIPRLHTSWIATKLQLGVTESSIVAPAKGKPKSYKEMKKVIQDVTKDWTGDWKDNFVWGMLL